MKTHDDSNGVINIKRNEITQTILNYLVTYRQLENGKMVVSGCLTIQLKDASEWYDKKESYIFTVSNMGWCCTNGNQLEKLSLEEMLDKCMPIGKEVEKKEICDCFQNLGYENVNVKFDTYNQRYVVSLDLKKYLKIGDVEENRGYYLYKYMSFKSFMAMLQNRTFRMNSVVSMNDKSETLVLRELLCATGDEEENWQNITTCSRTLITSFCSDYDSALMWRLYVDNGRGVCLSFLDEKKKVKPVMYVNENEVSENVQKLRQCINSLRDRKINVYIEQIDELRYWVKSVQFNYEHEYRLEYQPEDKKDLQFTVYNDLMCYYKDFPINKEGLIEEVELRLLGVIIGANLPQRDVNFPLIVDAVKSISGNIRINNSSVDKLRI